MLKLTDIVKNYLAGENEVHALQGINISFREQEFVSVLGPSGCGKTTLLNIIGGLDHYTSGDLVINGISTKDYSDKDWDIYRNHTIGFVFQNYNLIPHQTVLSNVELALTLSGVSKDERRKRAIEVLEKVGLGDQIYKKPNQMSGGQMQRVAIARALVNNPDILLADEPTGALDTETSVQIMELLKEVAQDKLVIMVTHNPELANQYSSRIIKLLDGKVTDDTNPVSDEEINENADDSLNKARTSMSFFTALSLSLNNLMTKKTRTFLTAFAGSIGIIGIALILSLSNGIHEYIAQVEEDTLSSYPIIIEKEQVDMSSIMETIMDAQKKPDHELDKIYSRNVVAQAFKTMIAESKENNLEGFKQYLDTSEEIKNCTNAIRYSYNVKPNIYLDNHDKILQVNPFDISGSGMSLGNSGMVQMQNQMMQDTWVEMIDNQKLLESQYEIVAGKWPQGSNECVLVVDQYNQIYDMTLYALGLKDSKTLYEMFFAAMGNLGNNNIADSIDDEDTSYTYEDIIGLSYKLVIPSDKYVYDEASGTYIDNSGNAAFMKDVIDKSYNVTLVGIIRIKPDAVSATIQPGSIAYTSELTKYYIEEIQKSELVKKQLSDENVDVFTGLPFKPAKEPSYTPAEKAKMFKEYITTLDNSKKAELFKKIYATPSAEELNKIIKSAMVQYPDRAAKQKYIIESTISMMNLIKEGKLDSSQLEESGFEDENLKQLINLPAEQVTEMLNQSYTQIPDAEFDKIFTEMISAMVTMQYQNQGSDSFSDVPDEELGQMLDIFISSKKDEDIALLYDSYMPAVYSSSTLDNNKAVLGLCYLESPSKISIYAKSFDDKELLKDLIVKYNNDREEKDKITYTDFVGLMMSSITNIVDIISYVLIAFVSISLIVSSIMIGIITYISVLERTKEIGILRSIGASKKDIARVFNAEAITIGFVSGSIGILFTVLVNIPISLIIKKLTDVGSIASLPIAGGIILIIISMFLTFIAGLIPSRIAAKKDPVLALRSE